MPELPEVETVVRGLRPLVQGRCIDSVQLPFPGCVQGGVQRFKNLLPGSCIHDLHRRGKLILCELTQGSTPEKHHDRSSAMSTTSLWLVSHLKMTGKFLFFRPGERFEDAHIRCIVHLSDSSTLVFKDQRKFGYLRLMSGQELIKWPFFANMGPEPLDISAQDFVARFQGRRAAIKSLLLDQKCVAGIGNIYADESLYLAGIHPRTHADTIPANSLKALHHSLQQVLMNALEAGGSSFRDYVDGLGRPGAYQNSFHVYGKSGTPCGICGCTLEKTKVAGRTSVYCPGCQPGNR